MMILTIALLQHGIHCEYRVFILVKTCLMGFILFFRSSKFIGHRQHGCNPTFVTGRCAGMSTYV